MAPVSALLWHHLRVYQIYGANTDVGKTIFATILCRAAAKLSKTEHVSYLKPVSTGPQDESDSLYAPLVSNSTLVQYDLACSPHSAAISSGRRIPSDSALLQEIYDSASKTAAKGPGWLFIETAGGVHSPGPSGTTQADLYSPLRTPVILVGDCKLGGISQTISAFESLKIRGYDVEAVLMFDGEYENHQYLKDYFRRSNADLLVETLPQPPARSESSAADQEQMQNYYESASSEGGHLSKLIGLLDKRGQTRIERLSSMSLEASKKIWYPFTQQKLLTPDRITTIDSASGDFFQTFTSRSGDSSSISADKPVLQPAFDGSASWWTQGLGHANPQLTLAAAYAAGRYGHVMFAEGIHEPALALAETLLRGLKNPRLTRVFYSDNGSTGCEVAVKMALRAARNRYGWSANDKLGILGLKGSYHGDTIGAMDCSEPGPFNEKVEWYEGKGFWFDFPTIRCSGRKWHVDVPEVLQQELGTGSQFDTLQEVLDVKARSGSAAFSQYKKYIHRVLEALRSKGAKFGALMLEPVILGAGGMIFSDPLFQNALVQVVRESPQLFTQAAEIPQNDEPHGWSGLPVVFDEVFTGLYRLGRFSSASFIDSHADISVHAKLLTGGLVPLCTTLASESIFSTFASDDKTDALLHGHSYTAHPIGCQVAVESLKELQALDHSGAWNWAKTNGWVPGKGESQTSPSDAIDGSPESPWSVWSKDFIDEVSSRTDKVDGVWALGSVFAITMRANDGAGYTSQAARKLQAHFHQGTGSWNAHTRVLGNMFYVMASQKTSKETVEDLQNLCLSGIA